MEHHPESIIATIAIGKKYFKDWYKYARPFWEKYAIRHGLGIIVFCEALISRTPGVEKSPAWQKCLAPSVVLRNAPSAKRVVIMDTDILMGPLARNIFDYVPDGKIGVVRYSSELPFNLIVIKKRLAFLRNKFYSPRYPLESELFASPREIFERRDLTPHDNYFTSGVICLTTPDQAGFLEDFYNSVSAQEADRLRKDFGYWEEPSINSALQGRSDLYWLPYNFQAIWSYEISWLYPFLFELGQKWRSDEETVAKVIASTLMNQDFLHFAGSWFESDMWKTPKIMEALSKNLASDDFIKYLQSTPRTESKGKVIP